MGRVNKAMCGAGSVFQIWADTLKANIVALGFQAGVVAGAAGGIVLVHVDVFCAQIGARLAG